MEPPRLDRSIPILFLVVGSGLAIGMALWGGDVVFAAVLTVVLVPLLWWVWPGRRGTHVDHEAAQRAAEADDLIVYWRPG